ncbi:MAG: LysR family transcriptional regulator [Pelagimonas sp.]|jgi:LysR family glycine cleavage system transcriptional activator|nr:LysR family transcriptional regulator [Pelagimonas sp.]
MLPSLPALRAFDAAARLGSFRAAANSLSVSATAISHHIRGLEDQLQVSLFQRIGRNVRLTEDGKRLAEATTQAFALLETAVERFQPDARRVVRISAGPIFTARWLMPRISDFWETHPGIELEFVPTWRPGGSGSSRAEIIIRWERLQDMPGNATKLLELQPIAVASPDFVARFGPFEQATDLLSVPILHQRNHWGWIDWFSAKGVKLSQPLRGAIFEDANVLIRGAAEGQGAIVGWLPLIDQDLKEGRVIRLFGERMPPTHGYFCEMNIENSGQRDTRSVFAWLCNNSQNL